MVRKQSLQNIRQRLEDLLPGESDQIVSAKSAKELLLIAINELEFRSNTLATTGFELGKKVHVENKIKANAPKGRVEKNNSINRELVAHFKKAHEGFMKHKNVASSPNPSQKATGMAWRSTQERFQRITGKTIKEESLKKRLRKDLRE